MSVLRTRKNGKWTVGSENLRDSEREDDIQRRTTGDGDGKINQPNRGFDAGGSKVLGCAVYPVQMCIFLTVSDSTRQISDRQKSHYQHEGTMFKNRMSWYFPAAGEFKA